MAAAKTERQIFDSLIRHAGESIPRIYEIWRRKRSVDPFLLSWPATKVKTYDGRWIDDICTLELPDSRADWSDYFRQTVSLTNPFALLLCEQRESDVRLVLESAFGTKSWTLPIQRRGDISLLGRAVEKTDVECIGLLWQPKVGQA